MVGFSFAGHNASQRLTGEAEDKQTVGDTMSAKYFSPNYVTARTQFRKAVEKAGGRLRALQIDAKGPNGEELTIDIAWFGAEKPKRVLVHSSGLHGVEAFAGSAVQLQWLDEGILSGLAPKSETTSLDSNSMERRMSDEFVSTEIHARVQVVGD